MKFNGNNTESVSDTIRTDVVIIGAGTVGLYIAARLHNQDPLRKIHLIESGNDKPSIKSNINNSISIGKFHDGTLNGRYSGVGGTSYKWGGQLAEFEPVDFDGNNSIWPVSYDEIRHYYNDVYTNLGLDYLFSKYKFDRLFSNNITDKKQKIENYHTVRLRSKDLNFANYFRKEINSDALTIITNTTAYKINFDNERAKELVCKSESGRIITIRANKFVFAAGTLGIVQFFLSTQALYDVPWKLNKKVGKYFLDHLGGVLGKIKLHDELKYRKLFERRIINGSKIEHKFTLKEEYRTGSFNGVALSFIHLSKNQKYIEEFKSSLRRTGSFKRPKDIFTSLVNLYMIRGYLFSFAKKLIFYRQIHEAFDNGIYVYAMSEQIPKSNSQITLSTDKRLENGLYKICVDWNWGGDEIDAIFSTAKALKKYLKQENIADFEIDLRVSNRDQDFLETFKDTYHQCGGMRMSNKEENGVVNPNCKVWGTENVWVTGASVFPSSSHANSVLTALALAERMVQTSLS